MANNVTVMALGGDPILCSVDTVEEAKKKLGLTQHTASVNGKPSSDSEILKDYDNVTLAPPSKGGRVILRKSSL